MTAASPAAAPDWDRAPLELPQRTRIEIFVVVPRGRMGESTSVEHARDA